MRWTWIVAAIACAGAAGGGWLAVERTPATPPEARAATPPAGPPPGFWVRAPAGDAAPGTAADAEERALVARLEAIGYLPGGDVAEPGATGVVLRTPQASPAPRLYVSGHAPEATLIDADGRVLHRWRHDPWQVWPEVPEERAHAMAHFRRAYLLPDGALLAIVEGVGVMALDREGRLLWARRNGAHHAADPQPDGRILLLTRTAHVVPDVDRVQPILEDFVVELDAQGHELRRVSLLRALLRSEWAHLARDPHPDLPPRNRPNVEAGDIHHTNSIQVLEADPPGEPRLRAGHVLVSSLHLSAVFAVDLDARRVVWLQRGDFRVQHEARLLPNGSLLLFDNHTPERGSRALELAVSGETVWQYPPPGAEASLYSGCCSTVERLPNGNTLIAVTEAGRALEVTPDHRIVWEFRTPHRVPGERGRRDLVAALFALTTVPEARALALAEAR